MKLMLGSCLALLFVCPSFATTLVEPPGIGTPVTLDGSFTNANEWLGVTPAGFYSPTDGSANAILASPPLANSFLYGRLAQGSVSLEPTLYVLFDYLGRTNPNFTNGEQVAKITFPTNLNASPIDVLLTGTGVGSGIAVTVDKHDGTTPASNPFVNAALGFHTSPNAGSSHMIIEFEVDLDLPSGLGGGLVPPMNGIYGVGPATWLASAASDLVDPPISSAIFQINPNGDLLITPFELGAPEPATWGLMLGGLLVIMRRGKLLRRP